jgi:hypothetical protein
VTPLLKSLHDLPSAFGTGCLTCDESRRLQVFFHEDWTADHEALVSFFSDPGKFYVADPYTFLFASLMVLILGAGLFSVDALVAKRLEVQV